YRIDVGDIVIDKKGAIVFFQYGGITEILDKPVNGSRMKKIDDDINERFANKIAKLINEMPLYTPATIGSKAVNSTKGGAYGNFTVKNKELVSL
ncbi:MAG: hypothetical protein KDC07_11925, partial [Chitinophagaceae bacterium]|nr:hypothetical protein [Chitinophagaceae bacterium]